MNFAAVEKIANAVLYEGYILYPYRPSSTKNRQRWNFGTLYPRKFAEAQKPAESYQLVAECLVTACAESKLDIRVRFLQLKPVLDSPGSQGWGEGVERSADKTGLTLNELLKQSRSFELSFDIPGAQPTNGIAARLQISVVVLQEGLFRLHLELANLAAIHDATRCTREDALPFSLTSAHLLLGIEEGEFVSLLEPPEQLRAAVAACHNVGVFPVLVGEEAQRSIMLCSPIILYDYPQVAPESAGDFFDGTEMDEMLARRVMTLTEDEKHEMRDSDARARAILERTESLPPEHLMKVHGAVRGMRRLNEEDQ